LIMSDLYVFDDSGAKALINPIVDSKANVNLSNVLNADFKLKAESAGVAGQWGLITGNISDQPELSFIYKCTGINDNIAISNLVNSFLNATGSYTGTTSLTMKLLINGSVGLPSSPNYGAGTETNPFRFFNIDSNQTRGARVHIDWSNARLPILTNQPTYTAYIYHQGLGCTIYHDKLSFSITGSVPYGIYNNGSATIYVTDSYCYCDNIATSFGLSQKTATIYNNSTGIIYINGCYCYNHTSSQVCTVIHNNDIGFIYITNSYCYSTIESGSVGASTYTVVNNSTGTIYLNNSYCHANNVSSGNNGSVITIQNNSTGTIYLSNSYLYATNSGANREVTGSYCVAIFFNDAGMAYIDNCYVFANNSATYGHGMAIITAWNYNGIIRMSNSTCIGMASGTSSQAYKSGWAVYLGPGSSGGYGKLIAINCTFRGYRMTSNSLNSEGVAICSSSGSGGQYFNIVLIGCLFNRIAIPGQTQDSDIILGSTPKYHIQGNIFASLSLSIGGSNITSVTATSTAYMPVNANVFGQTT
jgi:hypothetical protein